MIPMIKAVQVDDRPVISEMFLNSVSDFKSGVLERPIILKLIEYKPICVKIPAKIAGISHFV